MLTSRLYLLYPLICISLLTACISPPSAATPKPPVVTVEVTPSVAAAPAAQLTGLDLQPWVATSPNDVWQVEGLTALPKTGGEQYYTEMRVNKADGSAAWLPVATWSSFGLGYTTPQPVHWSPDGRYLYFTNAPVSDGCALFVNASDLQRLDLTNGEVQEVLPANTTWSLAIAPDGKTVAYSKGVEVALQDLTTGDVKLQKITDGESNIQVGNFIWSPDSRQLAFTLAYAPCQPPDWSHSILSIDAQSLTTTTLLDQDQRRFIVMDWPESSQLLLTDPDGQQWLLDSRSGAISQATE